MNPDEDNCATICSNKAGKARCTVIGQDADGDMHLSALCKAAPGDDCDDTQATVYPGAKEVCDGLDNDCNGKTDLYDGLPLAEKKTAFAALGHLSSNPRVAWDQGSSLYGVTWSFTTEGSTTESVAFAAFDAAAKTVVAPRIIESVDGKILDVRIAIGGGTFGIVWAVDYTNGTHAVAFNRVSPAGVVNPATLFPLAAGTTRGFNPRLAYTPIGNWLLAWLEYSTTQFSTMAKASLVDGADALVPQAQLIPADDHTGFDFALNAKGLVTLDTAGSATGSGLSVGVRSPDLTTSLGYLPYPGDTAVIDPLTVAGSTNFLTVWNDIGVDVRAGILKPDGTTLCGPVSLPFAPFGLLFVGDTQGYLAVSGQTLVNIGPDCSVKGPLAGASFYTNTSSDVGGTETTGYAIVSGNSDRVYGVTQIDFLTIGTDLCK